MLLIFTVVLSAADVSSADAPATRYKDGDVVARDTVWEGRIIVNGVVFVPEGVTLTIKPGTVVSFRKSNARFKDGGEGGASEVLIPGSGIRVEGKVTAAGTRAKNITFTSAEASPAPGDWGCIYLDHAKGSLFRRCRFEYSAYTLHAHFSSFDVSWSKLSRNEDGSRLGTSRVSFDHCDITGNTGKGLNFRQCRNTVTNCNITGNYEGIFLNEKDSDCRIEGNNIHDNTSMDLRLGEFHVEDVRLPGNWWGSSDMGEIRKHVYDKADDPAIGSAVIEPAPREIVGAGADAPSVKVLWKFKTGGFVDSSAAFADGVVFFGSWDRRMYAVKAGTGELVWSFQAGDCVDSSPAVKEGRVVFGSWDRNVYCLDEKDGRLLWKFEMPPSNFDDHRQSSPAIGAGMVFIGGFNGKIYALDLKDGSLKWEFKTDGPVRGRLNLSSYTVYSKVGGVENRKLRLFAGSGDGKLYAIDPVSGEPVWMFRTDGALYSSPAVAADYQMVGGERGPEMIMKAYVGSKDGKVYCLDWKGGNELWSYQSGGSIEYSSPLVVGDVIMVGSTDGKLYMLDRDNGTFYWAFDCGAAIYSSPLFIDYTIIVGDNNGRVYFWDPGSRKLLKVFRAGGAVQSLSASPDGVVYAGSRDGYLYALSLSE